MTPAADLSTLPAELGTLGVRPAIAAEARPFWEAAERGELVVERCDGCGLHVFPMRGVCRRCHGRSLSVVRVHPPGVLYSWTVNQHAWTPGISSYPIGIVEFPEHDGIRFVAPIEGLRGEPEIGCPMNFTFEQAVALGGLHRLRFRPWEQR